jgi:hypothetical protein
MCLGVIHQRKFGAPGTTVGNVAMSADTTASTRGTGVAMGEGIAITGGIERVQLARLVEGLAEPCCKG